MEKINEATALRNKIILLKAKQAEQLQSLKAQAHLTYENLKPINLIKNTFKEAVASADIKSDLINNAIGLASGYLSKKVLVGGTRNPLKKLLGAAIEFGVAKFVAGRADIFKAGKEEESEDEYD